MKPANEQEFSIAIYASTVQALNINSEYAVNALKNITHDPQQRSLITGSELEQIQKAIDILSGIKRRSII